MIQKISKGLDWHKIQYPQCLLIHTMVVILSVDTVVVRTIVVVHGEHEME